MLYHYIAQDKEGRIKEGNISQPNIEAALQFLTSQNLKPLTVRPFLLEKSRKRLFKKETMSLNDKIFLTKYLSLMLKVGTDLFTAIDILINDFESGPTRRFLVEVKLNLEKGQQFYLAFQNHPEYFSPVIANLIKAAENTGNLENILEQISKNLEKERDLNSKIKAALMYPIVLIIASFIMVIFLVTFVIPRLSKLFFSTGQNIPSYSRFVLTVGLFLNKNLFIILPLLFGIPIALYFYFFKTKKGKLYFNKLLEKIPVVKNFLEKVALARFALLLASLIRSGTPITKALEVVASAISYPPYEKAILRIAREYMPKGVSLGESFKRESVFPSVVTNLLAIGEKSGKTEEILETLAAFYESETEVALKTLVSFIEPAMLVIIGLVVGGIALALIVPIYQLVGQF